MFSSRLLTVGAPTGVWSVIVISPMSEHSKFLLADSQIPYRVGQRAAVACRSRWPRRCTPAPARRSAPQDLVPIFPMELIEQEFSPQAADRYSGRSDGHLPPVARHAAVSRAAPGKGARYAGPHLLQVRRHQPGGQPQAQHGGGAGVLQQARRHQTPGHRDRRRAVGQRAVAGLPACSAWNARSTWCASATTRSRTAA